MTIKELIDAIERKHKITGITINPPASHTVIQKFEKKIGFELPHDFKEFYSICDGFNCEEDMFIVISLEDALMREDHYGKDWYHFAEYMIYCDMWSLRRKPDGSFEIFNRSDIKLVLTSSLNYFLERFLQGQVFDPGGLYDWHKELKVK